MFEDMLHSLIIGFPQVIDYDYMVSFSKSNFDVMNIILSNLKMLERSEHTPSILC